MSNEITVNISTNENPVTFTGTISYYNMPHAGEGGFEIDLALSKLIDMAQRNKQFEDECLPDYPKYEIATRALARQTFRKRGKDPDIESSACECLAAALCKHINLFINYISNGAIEVNHVLEISQRPGNHVYLLVNNFLKENMARFVSRSNNGALEIDALFSKFIECIGAEGKIFAAEIIEKSKERISSWDGSKWSLDKSTFLLAKGIEEERIPWYLWCTQTPKEAEPLLHGERDDSFFKHIRFPRVFHVLSHVLLEDEVEPKFNIPIATPRNHITWGGDSYAIIAKQSESIVWAFGAHGERAEYARLPWLVPRSLDVCNKSKQGQQLPICYTPEEEEIPLPIIGSDNPGFAISPRASKTIIFMTACGREDTSQLSLGEMARRLNPQSTRIRRRDIINLIEDLKMILRLRVLTPRRSSVGLFTIDMPPDDADAKFFVRWKFDEFFKELMERQRGSFMINLSGLMALSAETDISAFRSYLLACYLFNNSHANDWQVKPIPILEWAARINSLRTSSIESIQTPGRRKHLSEDLKATFAGLEKLQDKRLIIFDSTKKQRLKETDTITIRATTDLKEAYRSRQKTNNESR